MVSTWRSLLRSIDSNLGFVCSYGIKYTIACRIIQVWVTKKEWARATGKRVAHRKRRFHRVEYENSREKRRLLCTQRGVGGRLWQHQSVEFHAYRLIVGHEIDLAVGCNTDSERAVLSSVERGYQQEILASLNFVAQRIGRVGREGRSTSRHG
jgi:hypothetical protein